MKLIIFFFLLISTFLNAQSPSGEFVLLKPDKVFDGETMHTGWSVLIKNNLIEEAGIIHTIPAHTTIIHLPGTTLLPGLIEGHAHLLLHPYNETSWNDQVLKESRAERIARAVNHARATLMAGFTTVRDLGTEGAEYDDVGLKKAIEKRVIPGPRLLIATKAIVVKGTYGPKSENPDVEWPQGAAEVAGREELTKEVRTQMGKGADLIKLYGDYRWGINGEAAPTFSTEDMAMVVSMAKDGGRKVVVHASTPEAMRRAALAGVSTIEHGDGGTLDVFKLMKEKGVAFCPTIAAGEAVAQYNGWNKGRDPEPARIQQKRKSFAAALQSGVTISMGGDAGVFAHGDNAREMELMVEYGMKPLDVLRSATSINADLFGLGNKLGRIKKGYLADVIAVEGDPAADIKNCRKVNLVIKDGVIYAHQQP